MSRLDAHAARPRVSPWTVVECRLSRRRLGRRLVQGVCGRAPKTGVPRCRTAISHETWPGVFAKRFRAAGAGAEARWFRLVKVSVQQYWSSGGPGRIWTLPCRAGFLLLSRSGSGLGYDRRLAASGNHELRPARCLAPRKLARSSGRASDASVSRSGYSDAVGLPRTAFGSPAAQLQDSDHKPVYWTHPHSN